MEVSYFLLLLVDWILAVITKWEGSLITPAKIVVSLIESFVIRQR